METLKASRKVRKLSSENLHKFYCHPEYNLYYMVPCSNAQYELIDGFSETEVQHAIANGVKVIAVYHSTAVVLPTDISNC